jgi:FdhD protein
LKRRPGSRTRARVLRVEDARAVERLDHLATEEPLEIRVIAGEARRTVAITMRTPGADFELAAGFLHGEGVLGTRDELRSIAYCVDRDLRQEQRYNTVTVELAAQELPTLSGLDRHFITTSACGVCGKASLDALVARGCTTLGEGPTLGAQLLLTMPDRMRAAQGLFDSTGGLHAAALFDAAGELLCLREDVGRHNAVDKVVGWAFLEDRVPIGGVLVVSGRASYEIVQKALAAGVSVVCAVSAPSSLAVDVAKRFGMTLVGFLREGRFNVYAGANRIQLGAGAGEPRSASKTG